jgi:hypothetical protein
MYVGTYVIVKYGRELCGIWTQEWLLWQDPEAIVWVNYRPILLSERAPHIKKTAIVKQKKKSRHGFQMGAWHQDRLTVGHNLTSTSTRVSQLPDGVTVSYCMERQSVSQ